MKSPEEILGDIRRRLTRTWAETLISEGSSSAWPHSFPLGAPQGAALDTTGDLFGWVRGWNSWALRNRSDPGIELVAATRVYRGTRQTLPTHFVVPSIDAAARLVGQGWPAQLARGRARLTSLRERSPFDVVDTAVLKTVDAYTEVDFALLLSAVRWFSGHPSSGYTPRQVPVVGIHSKWLTSGGRQELICRLAGLDDLGLNLERPHPVNFTYLDPEHRAGGGRRHDSIVPGDRAAPIYRPRLVLICENRDSAVFFPELAGAIVIQGSGFEGPARIAELLVDGWLPADARLVYWGDIDAHGFEIVNDYRARGIAIETILMDAAALDAYAMYGVNASPSREPLPRGRRRVLPHLTPEERQAYDAITAEASEVPARVEQERIPLQIALAAIRLDT